MSKDDTNDISNLIRNLNMATSENQIFNDSKSGISVRVFRSVASNANVYTIIITRTTVDLRWLIDSATLFDKTDADAIRLAIKMIDERAALIDAQKRAAVRDEEGEVIITAFAPA